MINTISSGPTSLSLPQSLANKRGFVGFLKDTQDILEKEKDRRLEKMLVDGCSLEALKFNAGFISGLSIAQGLLKDKIIDLNKEE